MVRSGSARRLRYEAKIDAEVSDTRTRALKPMMVRQQASYFSKVADLETRVKALIEKDTTSTLEVRDYLNYSRELMRLVSKFSGQTLNIEAQARLDKWETRGLDGVKLQNVAQLLGLELEGAERIESPFDFIRPGAWYKNPLLAVKDAGTNWSTMTVSSVDLKVTMWPVTRKVRIGAMGFYNDYSLLGSFYRLGIYASNKRREPTSLLWASDQLSTSTTEWKETSLDLTLPRGLYFLGISCSSMSWTLRATQFVCGILGASSYVANKRTAMGGWAADNPWPDLPDPFPPPPSMVEWSYVWQLQLRIDEVLD